MTFIAPGFYTDATPTEIERAITEAEATRDRYAEKASVLRGLLATRRDQIAAGTWTDKAEPAAEVAPWCTFGEDDAPGAGCVLPAGHEPANRHLVVPGDADDE